MSLVEHLEEAVWLWALLMILFGATWAIIWELFHKRPQQVRYVDSQVYPPLIIAGKDIGPIPIFFGDTFTCEYTVNINLDDGIIKRVLRNIEIEYAHDAITMRLEPSTDIVVEGSVDGATITTW